MFLDLIRKRRSIRKYEDRPVDKETIDRLVEAAVRAPSSRGLNPWEFVVVTDRDKLERLSRAKTHGASFARKASLAIVVCGNPDISDVWIEDVSIAAIFVHLAAASLGLGSCWIQFRKRMCDERKSAESVVAEILDLPPHLNVGAMIAIGHPAETKKPRSSDRLPWNTVHWERYGDKRPDDK